ncbi:MAG: hypothetical protein IJS03_04780 [Eubacterium sp.]|nr:hypothetical protein [Eubacterium sp.]
MKAKKNKKLISLLLAATLVAVSVAAGVIAWAAPVAINAVNFPDANFRYIVKDVCDEDNDGYLSDDEAAGVTLFSVAGYLAELGDDAKITDLKGIEYFTNLRTLRIGGIGLNSLDVSKLTKLTWLDCYGNNLETLNVNSNTQLQRLYCQDNELTSINVTNNTALQYFFCYANNISSINVVANRNLVDLRVHQNNLTTIDVSNNTALTTFYCSHNHIKELDLSANTSLTNVTDSRIGNQTIEATALAENNAVFVPVSFSNEGNIKSTSIDKITTVGEETMTILGYQRGSFTTDDIETMLDGITYHYYVGIEDAELMSVNINVIRDFYLVRFYTNAAKTTLLSKSVVSRGDSVQAPGDLDIPQCKAFDGWSESLDNVQGDMDVYAKWRDDHHRVIVTFQDNIVVVGCDNECGTVWAYTFNDLVGAREGDENYQDAVDVNHDGIINGRDLAFLKTNY